MAGISRGVSFAVIAAVYIIAFFCGLLLFNILISVLNPLSAFFAADAAATIIVWIFGLLFKNASMYDPYWSAAALTIVILFVCTSRSFYVVDLFYIIVFAVWGLRLTINWAINWRDLNSQDWRYSMLKDKNPRLWLITNFFGINFMPTLIVFAALLPAYFAILIGGSPNIVTYTGAVISTAAAVIQAVSDAQMLKFRNISSNKGKHMQTGLWRYSRHPNYFGEVAFWWGVWIIQISILPHVWWTVFAPILMTSLFLFISIPMMEKKLLATKESYREYKKATSMLMPLPKHRQKAI
jgi:steroid 5-alpha reductase family enzyme